MTRIRRLAIVLMTVSVIVATVYATGAFSNLTATRDANIQVAGDAAGYLAIKPAPGPNGAYASQRGGKLHISVGGSLDGGGAGINKDSLTSVRNIFTITNHGTQPLGIWITDKSKAVTFKGGTNWKTVEGRKNAVKLRPGKTLYVGLSIDTRGKTGGELINKMTIHANAEVSGATVKTGPSKPVVDKSSGTTTSSPDSSSSGDGSSSKSKDGDDSKSDSDKGKSDSDKSKPNSNKGDKSVKSHKDGSNLLKNVVDGAKALVLGFTLGNIGMPGGLFTAKESSSPLYLIGMLLNAIAPGPVGIVADLRDLAANIASGKLVSWGSVFNVIGLLPIFGTFDDFQDLSKTVQNWISVFPSQSDEVAGFIKRGIIKHFPIPNWGKAKLLGIFSDAPVSKLTAKGIPAEDIVKYSDEGVDFQRVLDLRSKGVSPKDIKYYVDNDIKLSRVNRLRDQGVPANRIRFFLGDGAPKMIGKLQSQGLDLAEVSHLIDEGADLKMVSKLRSQGVPTGYIRHYVEEGADLRQASKLYSRGVSQADISYYVNNGISLAGVNKLRTMHVPSGATKNILTWMKKASVTNELSIKKKKIELSPKKDNPYSIDISNENIQWINEKIEGKYKFSESAIIVAASTVNYNGWKDARKNKKKQKATQKAQKQKQDRSSRQSIRRHIGTSI